VKKEEHNHHLVKEDEKRWHQREEERKRSTLGKGEEKGRIDNRDLDLIIFQEKTPVSSTEIRNGGSAVSRVGSLKKTNKK